MSFKYGMMLCKLDSFINIVHQSADDQPMGRKGQSVKNAKLNDLNHLKILHSGNLIQYCSPQ